MPEVTDPYPPGTPCWVDLVTPDQRGALDFYHEVFGWTCEADPAQGGGYAVCTLAGRPVAGVVRAQALRARPVPPTVWVTYLAVADADATGRAIVQRGGSVLLPVTDVDGLGRVMLACDPPGAVFGIWQPRALAGAGLVNEPGALVWSELNTRDAGAAAAFYRGVFPLGISPMPEVPDYLVMDVAGHPVAGIQPMGRGFPPGEPSHWMTYFRVQDADRTIERLLRHGGRVVRPAFAIHAGRLAIVEDPSGGRFSVIATHAPRSAEPGG